MSTFAWLKEFKGPVLGISTGFQILAKIFDNDLLEKVTIGRHLKLR
jgi:gamma-glutamyl-gamma-aminobutyrate hydrolase PuuD